MSIDLLNSYSELGSKYKASQTYIETKVERDRLQRQTRDNLEQNNIKTTTTVENLQSTQQRYQRQMTTQLDNLLSIAQFGGGSGSATIAYIKRKFIETTIKIGPQIYGILEAEAIKALGCSQQQTYTPQSLYIPVKSVDLLGLLKTSPDINWARIAYEKLPPFIGQIPYSMNRQLWELLQNINNPIDYYGASGQKLFTIAYVNTNGVVSGDFFKVDLVNKTVGLNTVISFLVDYYKSIRLVETTNIFQILMDLLCGAISFEAKLGYGEIDKRNRLGLILQRILGLCFDNVREIDVSGVSKIAELDNIDQSFFEITEIDTRFIDEQIWNTQNGVIELEECQNVKLPVNSVAVVNALNSLLEITKVDDQVNAIMNLTNTLTDDDRWKTLLPTSIDAKLGIDLSFISNLPKAIMMALLSPKIILPLIIMAKAIGQLINTVINTISDFIVIFKRFTLNVTSKIGAIFVEELFHLIAKDIQRLLSSIAADLAREKALKKYAMIIKLIQIIMVIAKLVDDWRKCKSVIDELLSLFSLVRTTLNIGIPSPVLAASEMLDGYSATRAYINVIEEFQKVGLPTGPMPDGSPNLMLQAVYSIINGSAREQFENGKVQVFLKPLTVTPYGTLPTGNIYGKYY